MSKQTQKNIFGHEKYYILVFCTDLFDFLVSSGKCVGRKLCHNVVEKKWKRGGEDRRLRNINCEKNLFIYIYI
jgi:hypothetical protein